MDETISGSESKTPKESFPWHLDREALLAMPEEERVVYLNEKTSRLYEVLTMIAKAEGSPIRREDIEMILNPEEYEDRHKSLEELGQ